MRQMKIKKMANWPAAQQQAAARIFAQALPTPKQQPTPPITVVRSSWWPVENPSPTAWGWVPCMGSIDDEPESEAIIVKSETPTAEVRPYCEK